ncbi:MAG: KEOPS complex subunit Pcc1 [Candidatus Hodarchaeota archaeon]
MKGKLVSQVTIRLHFKDMEDAEQVKQVIDPDNAPLPAGLSITTRRDKNQLVINIYCSRGLESLGATVEDIMNAIDLSFRASELVE